MKFRAIAIPLLVAAYLVLAGCSSPAAPARESRGDGETTGQEAAPVAEKPAPADAVDIVRPPDEVPPPISRRQPEKVVVYLEAKEVDGWISSDNTYRFWTYGGKVGGPFLRVRVGDTVEVHLKNDPNNKFPHSVDFHAATGPGGGGKVSQTNPGQESVFVFKALNPGLYVYHCATPDIPTHVAHGMYGLILVEPEGGLPKVDREFYIMQGDFYAKGGDKGHLEFDAEAMDMEHPRFVVFNGKAFGLTGDRVMKAKVGERVRIFFGVGGVNVPSNFHVIGEIFDVVHPEGSTDGLKNVQTTLVPTGGATWVEFTIDAPGDYILVDHSLSRALHKGAVAVIRAEGPEKPDIFRKVQ